MQSEARYLHESPVHERYHGLLSDIIQKGGYEIRYGTLHSWNQILNMRIQTASGERNRKLPDSDPARLEPESSLI